MDKYLARRRKDWFNPQTYKKDRFVTKTAVTMFNGGVKENVIPQQAVAYVNFRLLPGDTPEMVRERIVELVNDPDITVEPTIAQPDTPPVADFEGSGYSVIEASNVARSSGFPNIRLFQQA